MRARVVWQEAVRLRSNYADAYTGLGMSLKELKRKEEAEVCFRQVVALRPACALSLGNLAGMSMFLEAWVVRFAGLAVLGGRRIHAIGKSHLGEGPGGSVLEGDARVQASGRGVPQ